MITDIRKGKILVVDDEAPMRRCIKKGLTIAGYECLEVSDSRETLINVQAEDPDLVILDIMMPGKSGRELLPEIVKSHPEVAVIMSTAIIEPKTIIECMKMGAQDYITKPFNVEEIVQSVDKALQMKSLEKRIAEYQKQLEHTVESQQSEIRELFLHSVEALVYALEAKDKYTAGHSRRVTKLSVAIGMGMGLPGDEIEDLRWGALLHDVGKIAIDPAIQNKAGPLTTEEYRHMMTHAMVGGGIVKPMASQTVIDVIVHHHDHFDGSGTEQCLRGEEIPLGARIVAVADSFDAMTSDRPYRSALSIETGIAEIKRCTATQYDPAVVNAFLKLERTDLMVSLHGSCLQMEYSKDQKANI
jgi:putative two-component system response regulator